MSRNYLIKTTEIWRVPDLEAADEMEEKFRQNPNYELNTFKKQEKQQTKGGEIIQDWIQVTAIKVVNIEKEPDSNVEVLYE